jgi:hypothetical protein
VLPAVEALALQLLADGPHARGVVAQGEVQVDVVGLEVEAEARLQPGADVDQHAAARLERQPGRGEGVRDAPPPPLPDHGPDLGRDRPAASVSTSSSSVSLAFAETLCSSHLTQAAGTPLIASCTPSRKARSVTASLAGAAAAAAVPGAHPGDPSASNRRANRGHRLPR